MLTKSKIFIFLTISFALGIFLASAVNIPRQCVYLFLAPVLGLFGLGFFNQSRKLLLGSALLLSAGLGTLRLQISMVPNQYQDLMDSKQQLEGYVVEDVNISNGQQQVQFRPKDFSQNIQISLPATQRLFYGDWIVAEGKLQEPKSYGDFDYESYLQRFNVYALMSYPKILMLKSHQLNPVKEQLLEIKVWFLDRLGRLLDEPQNSLAVGILIGGHSNLPKNIVDNFSRTGVSHIIAVSGFNISIIVAALSSLVYVFGRKITFWLSLSTIAAFVVIAGASASVLRAAFMGFLLLLAPRLGRQYAIVPSLFFAGLLMLLANPKILFWDVGFQLSFAATLGIVYFFPQLDKLAEKLPQAAGLKTLVLTTMSAILATSPLIVYHFGILSLSAPLVNVLVLPTVPWAMLFGFFAVVPIVGSGCAMVANWLLVYILTIINFFGGLPHSYLELQIPIWLFWLLLACVGLIYLALRQLNSHKLRAVESNLNL